MTDADVPVGGVQSIYREALFDRRLTQLRRQGGYAAVAADKAAAFLASLTGRIIPGGRCRFRFTRNGEYRIPNCRKVDLGCGYRIVCVQKAEKLVLLYIGTHDDCFRWIERHRLAEYDFDSVRSSSWLPVSPAAAMLSRHDRAVPDREDLAAAYEDKLTESIDDAVLRKIFAGLVGESG